MAWHDNCYITQMYFFFFFKTAQFIQPLKDELPVDEGALSGRVVTHYHHNNLFPGRKEPDAQCVCNLDQA